MLLTLKQKNRGSSVFHLRTKKKRGNSKFYRPKKKEGSWGQGRNEEE